MRYAPPGPPDSIISVGPYKNFIDGKRLDRAWQQEQFLLDAAAGEPEDFSLPAGDNLHFVTRSPAPRLAERTRREHPFLHRP
jgi:uncharacterized protein (DUF779 family)